MKELIVTNGDSARDLLIEAGIGTEVLPWRDVLHEGPVPLTSTVGELADIRADYIASRGWASLAEAREGFASRDATLERADDFDRVTLWFEHDLYDQLQLIQVLDRLAELDLPPGKLHLVQAPDYLGLQSPATIGRFQALSAEVSPDQTALARAAWTALRQPTPVELAALLDEDLGALPFLGSAVVRLLEELPAPGSGLSRSERQILQALADDAPLQPSAVFRASAAAEEAQFAGDGSVFGWLDGLAHGPVPLFAGLGDLRFDADLSTEDRRRYLQAQLALTDAGISVLAGQEDHVALNGIDRWLGGTHLRPGHVWRWDASTRKLMRDD